MRGPDLIAEFTVGGKMRRLLIEVTVPGYPSSLLQAFQVLQWACKSQRGYPVVVTDALSERGVRLAKEAGVGVLDLAGNCWLNLGELYIEKTAHAHVSRPPGELRRLFSPKATRVIRTLLEEHRKAWEIVKLAAASAVSVGHAYKVAQKLLQQGFLTQERKQVRLREPGALLDTWAQQYRIDPAAVQSFYTGVKDPAAATAHVANVAKERHLACAFTLHAGDSLVAPFTRLTDVHVYLTDPLSDDLLHALQLERIEFGGTVHVIQPYDEGVFQHLQRLNEIPVVCKTQLYL
ncbi:MAG: hypothetical protein HY599_02875, partial [Candidatus Omnitrophica bacterium]|nr:hypothetical protein [Candidatus Omnitrophota bacterium]